MQISRRSLLSGAVAASVGSVALSAKAADLCGIPQKWDQTWDVIVIGAGGAGLAAGITAKELGAKTIVLEKMAFPGGNTMVSGGGMNAAVAEDSKAAGVEDSPKLHAEQTLAAGDYRADPALVEILTSRAPESVEWLKKIGVVFRPGIYQIYGGLWPRCRNPEGQSGSDYIKAGIAYAKKIGLEILPGHKVTGIIRENPTSGRVLGVEVEVNGKKQNWRAIKGVVAAAGGYAANAEMCGFFDPRLTKLNTTNQPCSTGEVLRYIQDVNGLAVGMDYIQCIPWTAPGYTSTADVFQAIEFTIFVNKEGKRYVAEDNRRDVIRDATLAQTETYDYHDTQYEHVLRGPFHGFRLVYYCITLVTARFAVLHRQPESVDDVDDEQGSQTYGSYQRVPVCSQELTNHVIAIGRNQCNKVHRHVKR